MTGDFNLRCIDCGSIHPPTVNQLRCSDCGGLFEIAYSEPPAATAPRLPLPLGIPPATLGEGNTPVIPLPGLADALGLGALWAKLEFMAPTGSFKDRGSAVLISMALAEGVNEFVEDSSGNAGASLAAYAAAVGMKAHIFAPVSASRGKLDQIRIFGAELHTVEGPRQSATDAAVRFVDSHGFPYLSHNLSPFFSDGMKAVAYEVNASGAAEVEHVVLPVGNGSLLIGMKHGFDELIESGARRTSPAFHAVQSESIMPVVAAVNGQGWDTARALPTRASGIAVASPPRLAEMVQAVINSNGTAIAVSESSISEWQSKLARETGIFCEPTSAAGFAGLKTLTKNGVIPQGANVLVPITGSGLKEPL